MLYLSLLCIAAGLTGFAIIIHDCIVHYRNSPRN